MAAALVRYGLLSHCRLTPEAVEALLQLFVGLTVALAVVLLTAAHAVNAERQDGAPAPAPIPAAAARTAEEADEVVTRTQAVEESPPACLAAARALGTEEVDESGGPSFPPPHFLALSKGDAAKAQRRWDATRRWRREQGVNALLSRPHVNFEAARRAYPMFLHGRGRLGELVMFEMAGACMRV